MVNAQTCYYPDGSISFRDTPCHSPSVGDGASACCGYPDICLDNGLCLSQSGAEIVSRGSCTDQNWQSPECSQYCNDGNHLARPSRNLSNRGLHLGLILTLMLLLQSTPVVALLCFSCTTTRINGCSAAARVTNTTTHVPWAPKGAPPPFLLKLDTPSSTAHPVRHPPMTQTPPRLPARLR